MFKQISALKKEATARLLIESIIKEDNIILKGKL
jgi:hypothetical protein